MTQWRAMELYRVADESFSYTGGAGLAAAGFHGLIGYVSPDQRKNLTPAKVADVHAHGGMVGMVAEGTGTELAVPGAGRGLAERIEPVLEGLAPPSEALCYWALDEAVHGSQWTTVRDNLGVIGQVSAFRVGCYAGSKLLSWLHGQGVIDKRWVAGAYSWSDDWWPGPGSYPALDGAELLQIPGIVLGGAADADSVQQPDWAQWNPDGTIGVPSPPRSAMTGTMICGSGAPVYAVGNSLWHVTGGQVGNAVSILGQTSGWNDPATIPGATVRYLDANGNQHPGPGAGIWAVWVIPDALLNSMVAGNAGTVGHVVAGALVPQPDGIAGPVDASLHQTVPGVPCFDTPAAA